VHGKKHTTQYKTINQNNQSYADTTPFTTLSQKTRLAYSTAPSITWGIYFNDVLLSSAPHFTLDRSRYTQAGKKHWQNSEKIILRSTSCDWQPQT